jgi:hypothetical protein
MLFSELKRLVATKVHDPQNMLVGEALIEQFVNDGIDDLKSSGWLLPTEEDESILMVAGTYSYTIPADFAYIARLLEENFGDPGLYDYDIPENAWRPAYDGGAAKLMFNSLVWTPYSGYHIKIVGQKRPIKYTTDAATVEDGFIGFLRMRAEAYAMLYLASVPVEESTPELLERRIAVANVRIAVANSLMARSEQMLARHPAEFRVRESSRHVPSR